MASTGKHQWYVGEDGSICVGKPATHVTYHSALNAIIVTTEGPVVYVYDVTSGAILQKSDLSAIDGEKVTSVYLPEKNCMVFCDSESIGARKDLQGVLLIDTALQTPLTSQESTVKIELTYADAVQLNTSLESQSKDLICSDVLEIVSKELQQQIEIVKKATHGSHKAAKWATVCLQVPYYALKTVCACLVTEMKRMNFYNPGLSIASAVCDRLGYLLPSNLEADGGTVDRSLMYSEAARRETFTKWPHMNYKWALPDPMAQAGFYHQANMSGDDRALCFTCNVCLVCWEPTDEPWSEHERHSPSCPFVKGEHTQNVPLSITYATQPALPHSTDGQTITCVSTTAIENCMATGSVNGYVVVWNLKRKMKRHCNFTLDPTEPIVAVKTGIMVDREQYTQTTSVQTDDTNATKGAQSSTMIESDTVDAKLSGPATSGVSGVKVSTPLHDIPLLEDTTLTDEDQQMFKRPNKDMYLTSICIVKKADVEIIDSTAGGSSSEAFKKDKPSKVKRRIVQPSVICGVSFRCPRVRYNSDDDGGDVEVMNQVNRSVSGKLSPQIIPDTTNTATDATNTANTIDNDILESSTSFIPFIVVVCVKENAKKISKQASMDSLKPSTSSNNIVQNLTSMNHTDWSLLDQMYDLENDIQAVKVTPGPNTLSTSSPTEVFSKMDEPSDSTSGSLSGGTSSSDCAIKQRLPASKAGSVLQCLELPSDLQRENLEVRSITPTSDKLHIIVVISPHHRSVNPAHYSDNPQSVDPNKVRDNNTRDIPDTNDDINVVQSENCSAECNINTDVGGESADSSELDSDKISYGCILLYKFSYDSDSYYAAIDETPVCVRYTSLEDRGVRSVFVLPSEITDQIEEEESCNIKDGGYYSGVGRGKETDTPGGSGLPGQLAVIYNTGKLDILATCDLSVLASIQVSTEEKITDVTYCSGIDRLCVCTSQGKLHFYQLSEDIPEHSHIVLEGDLTHSIDSIDGAFGVDPGKSPDDGERVHKLGELLAKQQLSFDVLCQLHHLIQFENLMPRFTATVPPCWSEIQQEQQQRRHPQHLQQQGEATQHTRTWKLQPDQTSWSEHLFEIVLPRACCVGHVDIKFSLNALCPSTPDIQFTLLKQNISAIGRYSQPEATSTPVDSKINFNISQSSEPGTSQTGSAAPVNNVLDPMFLEKHNAEILCGPVSLAECLDLSRSGGLVSMTSPQLLMSKPRSLLLHIKGFKNKTVEEKIEKTKDSKKKRSASLSVERRSIKFILNSNCGNNKTKVDNYKCCDWLTELSITIRKTKKTPHIVRERYQRNSMIELSSFHERLLSTVGLEQGYILSGVSADHVQNMCLDILTWIINIQMNDPLSRPAGKCIISTIEVKLKAIIQACFIQGTRSTAHKCARLLTQCMQYGKVSSNPEIGYQFNLSLLQAQLDCLPQLLCTYSAAGLKWFFTILNRVKCMDVESMSVKCVQLLIDVAKHLHLASLPQHSLLKARYGLNGHPFELDMFDMYLPEAVNEVIPTTSSIYNSTFNTPTSANSNGGSGTTATQTNNLDMYEFFTNTSDKSSKSIIDNARNHTLGMLEVEPLHFTCHSTSDGTKMERLDNVGHSINTSMMNPFSGPNSSTNTMSGTINFGEPVPSGSQTAFNPSIISSVPMVTQPVATPKQIHDTKNYQSVKYKIMHIKQMLHEVNKNTSVSSGQGSGGSSDIPSTPKTTPQVMTPPLTPPNEVWQQMLQGVDKCEKSGECRPSLSTVQPSHVLLQPPPQQVLVIERIYSGARRFVTLDFGKSILLTDVIIPLCADLASLSIDVWVKGEETDGQRLVVAPDIGLRSLVMNNIMPPPVCRYLKITTIGRYGSGTTRSKIPIGAFYGHSCILPWELSTLHEPVEDNGRLMDVAAQSQLLSHLGSFMSLLEDVQCRYSLAKARLAALLQQVEALKFATHHTQYYLRKTKNNDEDNTILQAYNECIELQLQQNVAMRAIDRLQSAIGLHLPTTQYPDSITQLLKQANPHKLRCIEEHLLEVLMSVTNTCAAVAPASLFSNMQHEVCEDLFRYLCLSGTPRLQILTGMLLVRVCGTQAWFGQFLGNTLHDYFHSDTSHVFSQDRVFVLLTTMGQRALQGPRSVNVMESLLSMLARVLSPIHSTDSVVVSPAGYLDLTLVGWILLFLCRNLDNSISMGSLVEEQGATAGAGSSSAAGKRSQSHGSNLSNRWNFIAANGNVKSQLSKSQALRRRSLHKRLFHHKQKLMDMEQVKKNFMAQEQSLSKLQGKQFWKELTQFASKIRKTDAEMLRKLPRDVRQPEEREGVEIETDVVLVLPKETCLPVVHGLMALLLSMDFTCNVDLFLITCKVLARVCLTTRPAINLTEAMNQQQLQCLIMLAANLEFNHGNISWGGPWAGHAITCLLQDILEGEQLFPSSQYEGITDDEISSAAGNDESRPYNYDLSSLENDNQDLSGMDGADMDISTLPDLLEKTGPSSNYQDVLLSKILENQSTSSFYKDMDDDDPADKLHSYLTGMMTSMVQIDEEKYKPGNNAVKVIKPIFGSTGCPKHPTVESKAPSSTAQSASTLAAGLGHGFSTAQDARLELGLETHSELQLRNMLSLQADCLQSAFISPLPLAPADSGGATGWSRSSPTDTDSLPSISALSQQVRSYEMLSSAFDDLLGELIQQRVNMDSLLQLWLTLNEEPTLDSSTDGQNNFDPCRCPVVPLSVASVTNLLTCVAMMPSLPVRTWVLVFNSLTLLANLRIGGDEPRSMVVAMMADSNLVAVITKFLSVTSINSSSSPYEANIQIGPSAVKAFHVFLQRLRVCICGENNIHKLKEIMLKLVYTLTAKRGAFHSCLGPLDAQCKFLDSILELSYEHVDINNAISVIESVSSLVNRHIVCQEKVYCRSTSDNGGNARSCFGGMFASLLRGDSSSRSSDCSRDVLICSLLKLVNKLLQVHFPSKSGGRSGTDGADGISASAGNLSEPVSDSTKISQALATSSPRQPSLVGQLSPQQPSLVGQSSPRQPSLVGQSSPRQPSLVGQSSPRQPILVGQSSPRQPSFVGQSDEEKAEAGQTTETQTDAQTDEQKTESAHQQEQRASEDRSAESGINLADIILERHNIMNNFIQALSYCNSSTMAMLLGSSGIPSSMQESFTGGEPLSVGDGIYQILSSLSRHCSNSSSLMEALFLYLSGGFMALRYQSLCRLSEPLLWFMLKVLDSPSMLKMFLDKGGVEVVCRNFVNCNSRIISTSPSLVSTIMQNMNGQVMTDKRAKLESEPADGVQNFAPLGTIVSSSPTASPAEVLIVAIPQHRRTRSAPWSYHFYPDEAWVDLKITLPFAILLKEVQIQPHSQALSTCPAFVSLEASQDGVTTFPLCAPMNTGSLVYIKLQLQRPEVITTVTIRLHRARDSMTIGLSQILLMGYSAFGEVGYKTNNLFLPTEDFVSRSSMGWIRLLHHCLVSQKEMLQEVAEAAAPTRGLLNTCTALLVSPVSSLYSSTIEVVLLKLGLHSRQLGLSLIDNLLRSSRTVLDQDASPKYLGMLGGVANESTVDILYQLGTVHDTSIVDRLEAMLQWLGDSAQMAIHKHDVQSGYRDSYSRSGGASYNGSLGAGYSDLGAGYRDSMIGGMTTAGPAPLHVHCIATILWQSSDTVLDYNLCQLINNHLLRSLYEWCSVLPTESHLKRAVDYVLCAICRICPESFSRLMQWMGIDIQYEVNLTASISDDSKDSQYHDGMTDDSKEASSARSMEQNSGSGIMDEQNSSASQNNISASDIDSEEITETNRHMTLDESHLQTLAVASQSSLATNQLLESGFPAQLARGLFEFCNKVISNFADSWSQPEGISDSCKSMNGTSGTGNTTTQNLNNSLTVTSDMVESVLNYFTEMCTEPAMKDWLGGADGSIFWPVLLTMLCNTPLHSPISLTALQHKHKLMTVEERGHIENASVQFYRKVISCHTANQMLFAKVLYDVIKEQGLANNAGVGVCPLSGFTRRLFLQVLLEDESVLVAFHSLPVPCQMTNLTTQTLVQHPQYGAGRRYTTMMVSLHMTIGELINKVSDSPGIASQLLDAHNGKQKSDETKEVGQTCQLGLELVDVIENMASGKSGDKTTTTTTIQTTSSTPAMSYTSIASLPGNPVSSLSGIPASKMPGKGGNHGRPPTRRGRNTETSRQLHVATISLHNKLINNKSLPSDLSLSSLLQCLQQHGCIEGQDVLDFTLSFQNSTHDDIGEVRDDIEEVPDDVLLASPPFPTPLQIFANVGGLALLAEHLPLLYPELSRQMAPPQTRESTANMTNGTDNSNDWVTVDNYPEDFYTLYEPMSPAPPTSSSHQLGNLSIPPHSLVAFGLFLRLPGYAEVLLKERKKAQCLLRLMLGVTDDGAGGQILTSPIAGTLPTLPFIVLKSLFDTTPVSTDDGVLLRRMCLENGALHLILACLSVLSHHSPRVSLPGFQHEAYTLLNAMQAAPTTAPDPAPSSEKCQQYWAKGTGFGTGSTTSSWDAEQALLRQKSEEEHVTCLLQLLASYMNPRGSVPDNFTNEDYEPSTDHAVVADVVAEMLLQSCLVPAMSSYLRNDSVLDMARHVPLYRALLELLRGISVCPSLVQLLLPLDGDTGGDGATAVGELLKKMRSCVDTYASRLKSNKGKSSGIQSKEDEEENEGLATLLLDIQITATIVHTATSRLNIQHGTTEEEAGRQSQPGYDTTQEDVQQIYLKEMQKLQFDQYEMVTEEGCNIKFIIRHHYESSVKAAGDIKNPTRIRRLAQEAVTLSTSLPLSVSSSVFVRCDEERLDIMKVLITGPEDTPYANGCFEFDVYFPQDYPNAPPNINLETTGNHSVRFNPNLYNDGKVCLSVLNTWHGRPEEKWSPQTSSFLQVLVSIQSLILVCEPYFNEPGYERSRGTISGTASSREYDANIRQATVKWAILEQLKNPSPCFKEVIHKHFWLKRHKILKQCEEWIGEMESYSSDKRTGRTILHNTLALKKHYNQLREEFSKLKAPEGLENIEKEEINPQDKHYATDQNSATSSSKVLPQIVPADSNANSVSPIPGTEALDTMAAFLAGGDDAGTSSANC